MNSNLEFLSSYILEENISDTLIIEKDLIYILGVKFPILINEKGSFIKIKNITLDEETSSKLTCLMWNLNFLNRTLQKSNNFFGFSHLKEKVIELLITAMGNLEKSNSLKDVVSLTNQLEQERSFINEGIIDVPEAQIN